MTAGIGVMEIGARQLNNWRLHEPPGLLPFCQSGVLSTRLYNSLMPRHYFRLHHFPDHKKVLPLLLLLVFPAF